MRGLVSQFMLKKGTDRDVEDSIYVIFYEKNHVRKIKCITYRNRFCYQYQMIIYGIKLSNIISAVLEISAILNRYYVVYYISVDTGRKRN